MAEVGLFSILGRRLFFSWSSNKDVLVLGDVGQTDLAEHLVQRRVQCDLAFDVQRAGNRVWIDPCFFQRPMIELNLDPRSIL